MKCPPVPAHEKERLAALDSYCLADDAAVTDLSPLVEMALHRVQGPHGGGEHDRCRFARRAADTQDGASEDTR